MQRSGFSLVELSIVLVILGLLIGGILGGQSLIKAAELRSVITDKDKYNVAINAFKVKYNALPGDMSNAIDYWGAAHATPATCQTTASTTAATCNGNGDGLITANYEMYRAWQQLANAGLVEGTFNGIGGGTGTQATPGTNVPTSKINGGGWTLLNMGTQADGNWFAGSFKHALQLGALVTNDTTYGALLTPEDAYSIDGKVDDSKPGTGTVAGTRTPSTCTTTTSGATAAYALSTTGSVCAMAFKLGY